jgi:hypothetical protein
VKSFANLNVDLRREEIRTLANELGVSVLIKTEKEKRAEIERNSKGDQKKGIWSRLLKGEPEKHNSGPSSS